MPFTLSAASFVLYHAIAPLPSIDTLVDRLQAPRKGITSYEVIVNARKVEGKANPHIQHFWVDGDRYRVDFLDQVEIKGIFRISARRWIRTKNVPDDGLFFDVHYDNPFRPNHVASLKPL